jgi:hypothetical protein
VTASCSTKDSDRLFEPVDPRPGTIERDAGRPILGLVPAGANADDDTPVAEAIEGRQLLGEHGRMAEVVVEDERTEAQPLGGYRDGGEDRDRRQLRGQVVMDGRSRCSRSMRQRVRPR